MARVEKKNAKQLGSLRSGSIRAAGGLDHRDIAGRGVGVVEVRLLPAANALSLPLSTPGRVCFFLGRGGEVLGRGLGGGRGVFGEVVGEVATLAVKPPGLRQWGNPYGNRRQTEREPPFWGKPKLREMLQASECAWVHLPGEQSRSQT